MRDKDVSKWAKAAVEALKGNTVICPSCGKGYVDVDFRPYKENGDEGMVILRCSRCEEQIHFSHQKKLK